MLATIPLRRPRQGTVPTPRIVIPSAPSTSATTAQTFVVPMSRPTTISPCEAAVLILVGNRTAQTRGPSFYSSPSVPEEHVVFARRCHGRAEQRVAGEQPHAAVPAEDRIRRV